MDSTEYMNMYKGPHWAVWKPKGRACFFHIR